MSTSGTEDEKRMQEHTLVLNIQMSSSNINLRQLVSVKQWQLQGVMRILNLKNFLKQQLKINPVAQSTLQSLNRRGCQMTILHKNVVGAISVNCTALWDPIYCCKAVCFVLIEDITKAIETHNF